MPGASQNGMQCSEFDALLTEALDGTLAGAKLERFRGHAAVCSVCGPLFAEVDAGRRLLMSLQEVEPPARLMNNILAATSTAGKTTIPVDNQNRGRNATTAKGRTRPCWPSPRMLRLS